MESDAHLSPMRPAETPDRYPAEAESWVPLVGGERIFVRPLVPDDVARIEHAFAVADIDTIRRRFFTAAPPTDRAHLEYLATVDEPPSRTAPSLTSTVTGGPPGERLSCLTSPSSSRPVFSQILPEKVTLLVPCTGPSCTSGVPGDRRLREAVCAVGDGLRGGVGGHRSL